MGKKESAQKPPRVVLDTNVLVSALLFRRGELAWLRERWQSGMVTPVASQEAVDELVRVLGYPKFRLQREDVEQLLGLYLPFAELVLTGPRHHPSAPKCRDADDQKFVELAYRAGADALVTGDRALLDLSGATPFPILTPAEFRQHLDIQQQG